MARNVRVHELAHELGMTNQEAVELCARLGVPVKSHSSSLNEAYADMVRRRAIHDGLTRKQQPEERDSGGATARNVRVHELARELGMTNQEAVEFCARLGVPVENHFSSLNEAYADMVRRRANRERLTRDAHTAEGSAGAAWVADPEPETVEFEATNAPDGAVTSKGAGVAQRRPARFRISRASGRRAIRSAQELIAGGESATVEFKQTGRWNARTEQRDKSVEGAIVKTVAAFLNTDGGTLLIGVADDGEVVGIEPELHTVKRGNRDGYGLFVTDLLINEIGKVETRQVDVSFETLEGRTLCRIDVPRRSPAPVFAEPTNSFYVRLTNSTHKLDHKEFLEYVRDHWPG